MKRLSLKLPLACAVIGAALVFSANGHWPWTRLSDISTTEPILVTSAYRIEADTLRSGENVATLLNRQGISGLNLKAIASQLSLDTKRIKAGLIFLVHRDGVTNEATHIEFRPNPEQRVQFIHTSLGWTGQTVPVRWSIDTVRVSSDIKSSIYDAIDAQVAEGTLDMSERRKVVYALSDVYGSSVDFTRDLRSGDHIALVMERRISEEGETQFGQVLAGALILHPSGVAKEVDAFHYTGGGKSGYYDADGKSRKGAFLRNPLDIRSISSHFSLSRFHPILGLMRKHEGTDFAADRGTPVRATGDGRVTVAGWSGGYGNLIEIQHDHGVVTRYGHLSKVLVHVGARVSQSDVIGLVGSTGLATGPHLHYEFRVNGIARDSEGKAQAWAYGTGDSMSTEYFPDFARERDALLQLLGPSSRVHTTATVAE